MIVAVVALAVVVGVALGLLGGGGSILTVPLLVYVAGLEPKAAIATSLLVVAVTSAAGAASHARGGRVRWKTGLVFGAAGMAGAYAGGRLAELVPGTWLLGAFAVMMLATAAAMIRGRRGRSRDSRHDVALPLVVTEGVVVGLVTGLVGAGGGFLVVPALVLLGGLPMDVAVGTSLVVIAMKSTAGLAGYLHSVEIDWPLAAAVTSAAVVGSVLGGRLTTRVDDDVLRKGFGWFVAVMGVFVLVRELPPGLLTLPLLAVVVPVATVAAATLTWRLRRARQRRHRLVGPSPVRHQA